MGGRRDGLENYHSLVSCTSKAEEKLLIRYPLEVDRNIVGKARLVSKEMSFPGDIPRG